MKYVRFQRGDQIEYGVVNGDEACVIRGSIFGDHDVTDIRYKISEVKILPPVVPSKIICIGINYLEHIKEIGEEVPKIPRYFLKPPSALIGHGDPIVFPKNAERVDYEGEMAVIIGRKMKEVSEGKAIEYVLGYSCFNDVTERAILFRNGKDLTLAKGFDTFAALGPFIATGIDPNHQEIKTYLNGKVVQHDNTRSCVMKVPFLLHYLSQGMTLYPGDVVSTGTSLGIGPMKPGDVVEIEVEGVGTLRNPVEAHQPAR
jgi:2-keto-4-pentenoate hydratase/2-oxohepta-3-ene-1,7-dioic acid hydratase in catechol pathway